MKRLIFSLFFLLLGAGLGGGGLYVALNWKDLNPFRDKQRIAAKTLQDKFRALCATDRDLRGAFIRSAEIKDGKLTVLGFTANKDQVARLQSMGQKELDENPDLKAQCEQGLSVDGLQVIAFFDQLPVWQREFEEFKGAEQDTKENAVKREVMRTTRLDGIKLNEEGSKLIVSGLCIRGDKKPDASKTVLADLVKARIATAGVPETLMPDLELDVQFRANPATALQNKLALVPGAKGVHVVSAHYDGKGKLYLQAIIPNEDQRKFIDDALDSMLKDPKMLDLVKSPGTKDSAVEFVLDPVVFDGPAIAKRLQKKLADQAAKNSKPALRRIRLSGIVPAAVVDEKKEIITDDEGNPSFVFRVTGRMFASGDERMQMEEDLENWLAEELPRLNNANQTPIAPKLEVVVRESPVTALQERAVQRLLDGVAITDALFDGAGKLEIVGRLHEPGASPVVEAAVKDLLADETPWTIALKPHESVKDGQPIAWKDAVRECRAKLANDNGLGQRVRLDRLYFANEGGTMKLVSQGTFLTDGPGEKPGLTIAKNVDAVVQTRNKIPVVIGNLKEIANPLSELQNLLSARPEFDGALLTHLRYDADGRLQLDGFVGQAEHKAALTPLLTDRLTAIPALLTKGAPVWSLDSLKPHPAPKGDWKWPDVVRACQTELASAPESALQRSFLERAFFRYDLGQGSRPRRLTLQCNAIRLAMPNEKLNAADLAKKIETVVKRSLPDAALEGTVVETHQTKTPIYELQKLAAERKFDGMLFADAFYDREGKLTFDGMRSGDAKDMKQMIEQHLAKDKKSIAPNGLADLDRLKLSPWQAMLDKARSNFSSDAQAVLKQTRIDRAYFEHPADGARPRIRFEGIRIYQGKQPIPEQVPALLTQTLKKQLEANGFTGFEVSIEGIEPRANPVADLQKKAIDLGMDGVVLNHIAFDAKGICYLKLPLVPKGQEANLRQLLDEAAKTHPYLKGIEQR